MLVLWLCPWPCEWPWPPPPWLWPWLPRNANMPTMFTSSPITDTAWKHTVRNGLTWFTIQKQSQHCRLLYKISLYFYQIWDGYFTWQEKHAFINSYHNLIICLYSKTSIFRPLLVPSQSGLNSEVVWLLGFVFQLVWIFISLLGFDTDWYAKHVCVSLHKTSNTK